MSRMSEAELRFLRRRDALVRAWPWVGSACLLGLIALAAVLFWWVPQLVNPWFVFDQINADALPAFYLLLQPVWRRGLNNGNGGDEGLVNF